MKDYGTRIYQASVDQIRETRGIGALFCRITALVKNHIYLKYQTTIIGKKNLKRGHPMEFMRIHNEDSAILNGCTIRKAEPSDKLEIILDKDNYLTFFFYKDALLLEINDLRFTVLKNLYTLLESLERFGLYTRIKNISGAITLPIKLMDLLEDTGVLDIRGDRLPFGSINAADY